MQHLTVTIIMKFGMHFNYIMHQNGSRLLDHGKLFSSSYENGSLQFGMFAGIQLCAMHLVPMEEYVHPPTHAPVNQDGQGPPVISMSCYLN